jgi:hypothetical protein
MTPNLKMATVQEKPLGVLWFFGTKYVIKTHRCYRTEYEKIHLQIMLLGVGYSSFKRLVVFFTEKGLVDRALHRKMSIESRKRFLAAHKNQPDELLCS